MAMLTRNVLLLAKIEATEGVDPTPTETANAVLAINPVPSIQADEIRRQIAVGHLSPLGTVPGIRSMQLTFQTELRGIGAVPLAGSPLRIDPLLRACALLPTYSPSSNSVVYKPVSTAIPSVTLYAYLDGIVAKLHGARGNVSCNTEAGQPGTLSWTFSGVFGALPAGAGSGDIADAANPASPVFDGFSTKPPPVMGATFSIDPGGGPITTLSIQAASWDLQNTIQQDVSISAAGGIEAFLLTERAPILSINPKAVTRATLDFFRNWQEQVEAAIAYTVGSVSGNRVRINAAAAQHGIPQWGERNGFRTFEVPFSLNADTEAGNDEMTLIWD